LLNALFLPDDGFIEVRALPSKDRIFIRPGDMAAMNRFVNNHQRENLFFGVAARRDSASGALKNCTLLACLFADVDFKAFPSPEAARAKLEQFPLRPSYIVHSGGGLHGYWMLNDPINLQTRAIEAKNLLRRLARAVAADLDAAEPARVLRVPGTFNHKYNPPRSVNLE
jgi:hypothetical protein